MHTRLLVEFVVLSRVKSLVKYDERKKSSFAEDAVEAMDSSGLGGEGWRLGLRKRFLGRVGWWALWVVLSVGNGNIDSLRIFELDFLLVS